MKWYNIRDIHRFHTFVMHAVASSEEKEEREIKGWQTQPRVYNVSVWSG